MLGDASSSSKYGLPTHSPIEDLTFRCAIALPDFLYGQALKFLSIRSEFECFLRKESLNISVRFSEEVGPGYSRPGSDADLQEPGICASRSGQKGAPESSRKCRDFRSGPPSRRETAGAGAARCCPPWPRTPARAETRRWSLTAPRVLCSCAFRPTPSTEGEAQRAPRPAPRVPARALGVAPQPPSPWVARVSLSPPGGLRDLAVEGRVCIARLVSAAVKQIETETGLRSGRASRSDLVFAYGRRVSQANRPGGKFSI